MKATWGNVCDKTSLQDLCLALLCFCDDLDPSLFMGTASMAVGDAFWRLCFTSTLYSWPRHPASICEMEGGFSEEVTSCFHAWSPRESQAWRVMPGPSTWETETGESTWVRDQPELQSGFQDHLNYQVGLCLKKKWQNKVTIEEWVLLGQKYTVICYCLFSLMGKFKGHQWLIRHGLLIYCLFQMCLNLDNQIRVSFIISSKISGFH